MVPLSAAFINSKRLDSQPVPLWQGDNETRNEGSEETGMYEVVTVEVKPVDAIASE